MIVDLHQSSALRPPFRRRRLLSPGINDTSVISEDIIDGEEVTRLPASCPQSMLTHDDPIRLYKDPIKVSMTGETCSNDGVWIHETQTINMLNIKTAVQLCSILTDRPAGRPARRLARVLPPTWAAERLSGQLSKLQPNQAPCHLPANSASSCQAQESSGTLVGGGNVCHLAWKHNLGRSGRSDVELGSVDAARRLSESPLTIMKLALTMLPFSGCSSACRHHQPRCSQPILFFPCISSQRVTPLNARP